MSTNLGRGTNVFAVPHGDSYIVYAPLAGRIVHANARCVAQLRRYLETGDEQVVDAPVVGRLGGLDWLDRHDEPAPLPLDRHYHPADVTLFLTNRCNLRCSYCYAEAGELAARVMPPEVFRAAIDLVAHNARRAGRPPGVGFHGGGEPTTAWRALLGAIEHARSVAGKNGVRLAIATNGVMSRAKAELVATTFPMVTLSFDGPPDIQDEQRPMANGAGSFEAVMAFIEVLQRHGTAFTIRSTITERTVARQEELVDFFLARTRCRQLHFEPVFLAGRHRRRGGRGVPGASYAKHFMAAYDRAVAGGAVLRYSAARLGGPHLSFCGVAQDPFSVTPDGDVTACFEVCHRDNPLAKAFYFGRFEPGRGRFVIDAARLAHLRSVIVVNKPLCDGCFARWSCAGDCPVKMGRARFDFARPSPRCRMNQAITKALLVRALEGRLCAQPP
jgi:uncharacterized protein